MSQLRERIALLITSAEGQGWHTIVAPIDFMRAAFLDAPAGMEDRLRKRAIRLEAAEPEASLVSGDAALLNAAADMIAAFAAHVPQSVVDAHDRIMLINLIDIIDHALLHIPQGKVHENAQATRDELWHALTGRPRAASTEDPAQEKSDTGLDETEDDGGESAERDDVGEEEAKPSEGFEARANAQAVAGLLRTSFSSLESGKAPSEDDLLAAAEAVDELYAYDLDRLNRERADSKQFESSMISEWLEAHEKAIDAERRALKARQREREAVERCAKVAEEPVDLPPDARAIRLAVHAVQRHIAASIRRRGLSG